MMTPFEAVTGQDIPSLNPTNEVGSSAEELLEEDGRIIDNPYCKQYTPAIGLWSGHARVLICCRVAN